MGPTSKIFVAGHTGLVGSALCRRLRKNGFNNLLTRSHKELDLTDQLAVRSLFSIERPGYVFLAAARVGGILANNSFPAEFLRENILIQTNVIEEAYRSGVERLLFLGSSCVYPKDAPQPIKEEYLLQGPLEATNRPYAVAKISGIEMCWAYNRQYGTKFIATMPTNLYGPNDNYDLENSHVLAALIRKFHEAKLNHSKSVTIWGTGTPRREFLHSDDAADACIMLMELPDDQLKRLLISDNHPPLVNIGCEKDLSIRQLAEMIAEVVGTHCQLSFDASKPDGTPRKLLDISLLDGLGWHPAISLPDGLQMTYRDYCESFNCIETKNDPRSITTLSYKEKAPKPSLA